ncbi:MAG: CbiX/SirB N-terminal domain-containing protein [Actinomycetota bacterium]|nr:CbiX/SirB N-terminal domain-containing protein [Actinomycetota bacterium]MDP2288097.1 CbiX/SirB N-terminal domain-containing protein [Actinomycetota bacterium]
MGELVVLLAHGSPDPRSSEAAAAIAADFERHLQGPMVRIAYLQHNWPTLTAAIGRELDSGTITKVRVLPLILTEATHAIRDIPDAIARAERDHRMTLEVGKTIGMDPSLGLALESLIPAGVPVVLAWAGGRTPAALASTQALAETWAAQSGREVVLAIVSESGDAIVAGVQDLQQRTGLAPVVATFTLFPGVLTDQISAAATRAGTSATTPLCQLPKLIDILDQRLHISSIDRVQTA